MNCPVCVTDGSAPVYQSTRTMEISVNCSNGASALVVESDKFCPTNSNCGMKNVPVRSAFIIKYCPECGRKLGADNND